jgi:hypothetical protein
MAVFAAMAPEKEKSHGQHLRSVHGLVSSFTYLLGYDLLSGQTGAVIKVKKPKSAVENSAAHCYRPFMRSPECYPERFGLSRRTLQKNFSSRRKA